MNIIDSHCHLFLPAFDTDFYQVLENARAAGVERVVNVGLDVLSSRMVIETAHEIPALHPTVGWHPHEAERFNERALDELIELAKNPAVVAFGEIGLDYFHNFADRAVQRRVLISLLEAAQQIDKPVIFHCREAYDDLFSLLSPQRDKFKGLLLHCFGAGPKELQRALELDFHISFSGTITFPKSKELRESVLLTPLDKILIETDSPYLAPVPHRSRRNEPALLVNHLEIVAQVLKTGPTEAAALTAENARRFFSLSGDKL
ncbi:MAG: TatD family hydrolase [Deltaproteobacteria bacterium]|jgi:TatD DNase family protein|nr:TatD family hydrolase [Deltaproteobacteria bacterium]